MAAERHREPILEVGGAQRSGERIGHRRQRLAIGQDKSDELVIGRFHEFDRHQIARTVGRRD